MSATESSQVRRFSIKRVRSAQSECVSDNVAAEEPLEIRLNYWFKDSKISESLAVTMRTPGHDRELAAGFLLSEGIIRRREQLLEIRALGAEPSNEIVAELSKDAEVEAWRYARNSFIGSSCGVCGKRSREAISQRFPATVEDTTRVDAALIEKLPSLLRGRQEGFTQTGGLHAAALVSNSGEVEGVFEDIGRHNALDKLLGSCVLGDRIPLKNYLLFLSSRSSFELIQKTVMAGAPILATVGAPSSLAIEIARERGVTLIGFVREGRFNIYSGEWRINS